MPQYAKKKDANHNTIVEWALSLGFGAVDTSRLGDGFPDSVMEFQLYRGLWVNDLWEIKDGKKGKLTEPEKEFFARWRGPRTVIRSFDDVYARREYWLAIAAALSTCEPLKTVLMKSETSYAQIQAEQQKL